MTSRPAQQVQFGRRVDWSREEWVVAWDACPKGNQNYGQSDRNVLEVAYLLNRTPSAVSHSFGNLWYAWSRGRHGARNASHFCAEVVSDYREDPGAFHSLALKTRAAFFGSSFAARLELHEVEGPGLLGPDSGRMILRESGLPQLGAITYNRPGSVLDGIVLNGEVLGAAILAGVGFTVGSRVVKLVERLLRNHRMQSRFPPEEYRTASWQSLKSGNETQFESLIVTRYVPSFVASEASSEQRRRLAGYLAVLLGVRPLPAASVETRETLDTGPSKTRIKQMERAIGTSLRGLSDRTLVELDLLLEGARSKGLERTMRKVRKRRRAARESYQRSLDEFG